jgi:hypothetical protein
MTGILMKLNKMSENKVVILADLNEQKMEMKIVCVKMMMMV